MMKGIVKRKRMVGGLTRMTLEEFKMKGMLVGTVGIEVMVGNLIRLWQRRLKEESRMMMMRLLG